MYTVRLFVDLSPAMQSALVRSSHQGVPPREVGSGRRHSVHLRTIQALERRGLIEMGRNQRGRAVWRPTTAGRDLLGMHVPKFLHRRSHRSGEALREGDGKRAGYTHRPWEAMRNEPEVVDGPLPKRFTRDTSRRETAS